MSYSVPRAAPTSRSTAQGSTPNGRAQGNGTLGAIAGPKMLPATNTHTQRMPRVTLSPTTRVASVGAAHPSTASSTTPPNSARALALPPAQHPDRTSATEAVNAVYEKTEAHLREIEEKLERMHEDLRQAATAKALVPPTPHTTSQHSPLAASDSASTSASHMGGSTTRNGFQRTSPLPSGQSTTTTTAVTTTLENPAGANHHLQPIQKPAEPPLMKTGERARPMRGTGLAQRASSPKPTPPVSTAKTAKAESLKTAAAGASPPPPRPAPAAAGGANTKKLNSDAVASRAHFSLDEGNVVETPDVSSVSDNSGSSSDDEDSTQAGSTTYLPTAAQHSFVTPTKPPPAAMAPAGSSLLSNAVARREGAATRQGLGFKGLAGANTNGGGAGAGGGGGRGRRGIKMNVSEADNAGPPFALPTPALDQSEKSVSSDGGQVFAVGRQRHRMSLEVSLNGGLCPDDTSPGVDNAKAVDGLSNTTRRQSHAITHMRERFFAPIPCFSDVLPHTEEGVFDKHDVEKMVLQGAPCSWLCCAALAISFITGIPTPIEKVLKTNHMGVHYIALPTVTLAELYDVTNDYIHTRFHRSATYNCDSAADEFEEDEDAATYLSAAELKELPDVHCEMATFDTEVLDPEPGDSVNGMGEHAPITSLAQFRKELMQHLSEDKSMYIFNYEPYVMEQAQLRLRSNMCDTEEEVAAVMRTARYVRKSVGHFGMLLSFDPVKHTATILTPYLSKEQYSLNFPESGEDGEEEEEGDATRGRRFESAFANLVLEKQTVSLQVLYESVNLKDPYTALSRGFVRVFRSAKFAPKVPCMFPLFVLDGSSAGGLMTSVLDVKIAPHVLGLAVLHHLSVTFLLSDNARRKQSSRNLLSKANVCDVKLRGIPLTKICQQLRLPLSMIVSASNKSSIATAYVWYHLFLQQLQIHQEVRIGLILPARRDGAEDGQPNITDTEFLDHLQLVVKSKSVMLISFDINVGLNVRIDSRGEPAHFAIVIGLDEERGIVRLADVNVKRFRKTWHVPINRLYNAVMGYGYIVAAKDKKIIKALNGKEFQESALQCAKYFLPPPAPTKCQRFEYPARPYPVTVLADAVERLGFPGTNVERFLNFSGFHISYFLSFDMPLECAAAVIENYSHYALDDAVSVTTSHYDFYEGNPPPSAEELKAMGLTGSQPADFKVRTEADLLQAIQYALAEPEKRELIIKYDVDIVAGDSAVWNGSSGSSFALLMGYEAATKVVMMTNADPSSFYRTFACPLGVLFSAVCSWDHVDLRARGTILLTTEVSQEAAYDNVKGYDMAHALVHHPFKPIFSAACSCLALAATEMMMNIETPTLLGGAPLSCGDEEKRKYKRYNNIFSGEDFLYALPAFSVHDWRTQPVDSQDVVSIANNAFTTLKLPLHAVDVLKGSEQARKDPLALLRACSGVSGLMTISLVAYDTGVLHGVPGTSVGVVNRVHVVGEDDKDDDDNGGASAAPLVVLNAPENSVGSVQLLEGDPCRWGACFVCSAEVLARAVVGIFLVEEVVEEGEDADK
ncbi:hypothetical protein ABB37_06219 [Leptomonas pyrrhocoris]|uniref:Uncharacterized protein n=1 Tax=Leptomonas pyrrhocoris TaxID=157538 RepID=A0A0M9FYN2_LEPPY|nr:hypothetical protein ABB37_06219 [Leptomonas pyrrhocoris]KPA78619.1 hypothetical protein ABB37_06219 [Leptomonas pyrrhocoris]|eukprot:XP_015657058.1 hypothetical protein ABB37_06219 [Leptomonas pyrrhocoris]